MQLKMPEHTHRRQSFWNRSIKPKRRSNYQDGGRECIKDREHHETNLCASETEAYQNMHTEPEQVEKPRQPILESPYTDGTSRRVPDSLEAKRTQHNGVAWGPCVDRGEELREEGIGCTPWQDGGRSAAFPREFPQEILRQQPQQAWGDYETPWRRLPFSIAFCSSEETARPADGLVNPYPGNRGWSSRR